MDGVEEGNVQYAREVKVRVRCTVRQKEVRVSR